LSSWSLQATGDANHGSKINPKTITLDLA